MPAASDGLCWAELVYDVEGFSASMVVHARVSRAPTYQDLDDLVDVLTLWEGAGFPPHFTPNAVRRTTSTTYVGARARSRDPRSDAVRALNPVNLAGQNDGDFQAPLPAELAGVAYWVCPGMRDRRSYVVGMFQQWSLAAPPTSLTYFQTGNTGPFEEGLRELLAGMSSAGLPMVGVKRRKPYGWFDVAAVGTVSDLRGIENKLGSQLRRVRRG